MTITTPLADIEQLREAMISLTESYAALSAELALSRDDVGWLRIGLADDQFGKKEIDQIAELARIMAVKNPLIKRGVQTIKNYVFAQGVKLQIDQSKINQVWQAFWDNPRNRLALTSEQTLQQLEIERQTDGNLFFVLFTDRITGTVRIRHLALSDITAIVRNPDDATEIRYYRREWTQINEDGTQERKTAYYPDIHFNPENKAATINSIAIEWNSPIVHFKTGGYSNWDWGLSELYAGIDWARAYKSFLEDWATITKSLSRFAWKSKAPNNRAVATVQRQLNANGAYDQIPAGSVAVMRPDYDLEPIKTSGATTSMDDGRRILLMVAASVGLPETFFGDASVGSLATAKSLDRPTELMMKTIQSWWSTVFDTVADYVVCQAVKAPRGALRSCGIVKNVDGVDVVEWLTDDATGEPYHATLSVQFPPIVNIDPVADVQAVVQAAPFLPDEQLIAKLLLNILGVDDVDEVLQSMFGDGSDGEQQQLDQNVTEALKRVAGLASVLVE